MKYNNVNFISYIQNKKLTLVIIILLKKNMWTQIKHIKKRLKKTNHHKKIIHSKIKKTHPQKTYNNHHLYIKHTKPLFEKKNKQY